MADETTARMRRCDHDRSTAGGSISVARSGAGGKHLRRARGRGPGPDTDHRRAAVAVSAPDSYPVAMVATSDELPLDYSAHIRVNRKVWEEWGTLLDRGPIGKRWGRSNALHRFMVEQVEQLRAEENNA